MSDNNPTTAHATLAPPHPVIEDPGAHELESGDEDEHFSDATEGNPPDASLPSGASSPIPTTRVEKVDEVPSHGEIPGTEAYNLRTQDAVPDEVDVVSRPKTPDAPIDDLPTTRPRSGTTPGDLPIPKTIVSKVDDSPRHGDVPGTDAFEKRKGDAQPDVVEERKEDAKTATEPYLRTIFPEAHTKEPSGPLPPLPALADDSSTFLNERSASLYAQLITPPPLQPPNWIQSRIRRLFLVSLGVPVDLDEILPASKQKKLVLPSTHLSVRSSHDRSRSPAYSSGGRQRDDTPTSRSKPQQSSSHNARKGPPPPPHGHLDFLVLRQLCATTDAALSILPVSEIEAHIKRLGDAHAQAVEVLSYWEQRMEGAVAEKQAFEGVIENLVKHARKVRK
ncbi:MAG: hypothetical protein M1817_000241 [Caeruleum heppii]|nr:MAG: hypothetical protein M1817_000241 [Caeruleum heppii]